MSKLSYKTKIADNRYENYLKAVVKEAEKFLAEGDTVSEAIEMAYGMVDWAKFGLSEEEANAKHELSPAEYTQVYRRMKPSTPQYDVNRGPGRSKPVYPEDLLGQPGMNMVLEDPNAVPQGEGYEEPFRIDPHGKFAEPFVLNLKPDEGSVGYFNPLVTPQGIWKMEPKWGKTAEVEGHANGDTNVVYQYIMSDHNNYEHVHKMIEKGATLDDLRDWALRTVIAPHNNTYIEGAREWNEMSPMDRPENPQWQEIMDKIDDPVQQRKMEELIGNPKHEEHDPTNNIIDPELVHWEELYQDFQSDLNEQKDYEKKQKHHEENYEYGSPTHDEHVNAMMDALLHKWVGPKGESHLRSPEYGMIPPEWPITERHEDEGYAPETWNERRPAYHDIAWDLTNKVQKGHASPDEIAQVQQALHERGYTPMQVVDYSRQRRQWNPESNLWEELEPKYEAKPEVSDTTPGDTTFPEEWTSKISKWWINNPESPFEYDEDTGDVHVYHRAPTEDRERIRTHGLFPSDPNKNPYWHEHGEGGYVENQPPGVYVTSVPAQLFSGPGLGHDLWRATISPHDLKEDPLFEDNTRFYTPYHVAPHQLQLEVPHEEDQVWPHEMHEQPSSHEVVKHFVDFKNPENLEKWKIGQPTSKVARPIDEEYWHDFADKFRNEPKPDPNPNYPKYLKHQPGWLYHNTDEWRLNRIMKEGLIPWNQTGRKQKWTEWLTPRPDHVYLKTKPSGYGIDIRVNPAYLDPKLVNPDEDAVHEYDPDVPTPWHDKSFYVKALGYNPQSLGEVAEREGWGNDPELTRKVLENEGSIAYKGIIPVEALMPGRGSPSFNPDERSWRPIPWEKGKPVPDWAHEGIEGEKKIISSQTPHLLDVGGKTWEWDRHKEEWVLHSIDNYGEMTVPNEDEYQSQDEERAHGVQISDDKAGIATINA